VPRKLQGYRIERNGTSLKFFKLGEYIGSVGIEQLGQIMEKIYEKRNG
jgi:hypothetical protein